MLPGLKFASPTIAGGKVFIPAGSEEEITTAAACGKQSLAAFPIVRRDGHRQCGCCAHYAAGCLADRDAHQHRSPYHFRRWGDRDDTDCHIRAHDLAVAALLDQCRHQAILDRSHRVAEIPGQAGRPVDPPAARIERQTIGKAAARAESVSRDAPTAHGQRARPGSSDIDGRQAGWQDGNDRPLPLQIIPPTLHKSIRPHGAAMVVSGADLAERSSRRAGLTAGVAAPAGQAVVAADGAGMRVTGVQRFIACPGGRRGDIAPTLQAAIAGKDAASEGASTADAGEIAPLPAGRPARSCSPPSKLLRPLRSARRYGPNRRLTRRKPWLGGLVRLPAGLPQQCASAIPEKPTGVCRPRSDRAKTRIAGRCGHREAIPSPTMDLAIQGAPAGIRLPRRELAEVQGWRAGLTRVVLTPAVRSAAGIQRAIELVPGADSRGDRHGCDRDRLAGFQDLGNRKYRPGTFRLIVLLPAVEKNRAQLAFPLPFTSSVQPFCCAPPLIEPVMMTVPVNTGVPLSLTCTSTVTGEPAGVVAGETVRLRVVAASSMVVLKDCTSGLSSSGRAPEGVSLS